MSLPTVVTQIVVNNQFTDRRMLITWQFNGAGDSVLYYNVYRSENQFSGFTLIAATNDPLTNSYLDTLPYAIDKTWFYKVTAINAFGESDITSTQAVTDFNYLTFYQAPNDLDFRAGLIRWVDGEIPTGTINGASNRFSVSGRIKPNSLQVYIKPIGYPGYFRLATSDYRVLTANAFSLTTTPTISLSITGTYTITLSDAIICDYVWF